MRFLISLLTFIVLLVSLGFAQEEAGRAFSTGKLSQNNIQLFSSAGQFSELKQTGSSFVYSTTTFTFSDLIVFSYIDGSIFYLSDAAGTILDSAALNSDQYHVFSPGQGVYRIESNNSFTLLTGDPVTNGVMGYFAVDEAGSPLSTRLNTYMPVNYYSGEHFILFAYNDGTEYYVYNLNDTTTIAAGVLNKGEHLELNGYNSTFIGIQSNKPVSALSYTDQGYYIPAANGTFAGEHFYGFSGYVGSWGNGIIVTAYNDNTTFLVTNSATGDTLAHGVLNMGEVSATPIYTDTYWELSADKKVTACNTPYAAWDGSYYYFVRQMEESGLGVGTNFYFGAIPGDLNLVSFADANQVYIVQKSTQDTVWQGILNSGDDIHYYTDKEVYHVTSAGNIAIITSYGGGWGADFMPLSFSLGLPDISLSSQGISFSPDSADLYSGDPLYMESEINNYGYTTAYDIMVRFYDGDPSGNLPISPRIWIDSLRAGEKKTVSYNWTVPQYPEYHAVYVAADWNNAITESNESNNTAYKFIIPNNDLLPPISTAVKAPPSVEVIGEDSLSFTEFEVLVSMFNTGTVGADNLVATIDLPAGLSLQDTSTRSQVWDYIPEGQSIVGSWQVLINTLTDEDAWFYSVLVEADSVQPKTVERMLLINRPVSLKQKETLQIPEFYTLSQNYPNPFNPATRIAFELPKNEQVNLTVFNVHGQKVVELVNGALNAGHYEVEFNGSALASGLYFYRLTAGSYTETKRMLYVK